MRNLTPEDVLDNLDDNGEVEEGCVAVEATVQELADLRVSTSCGRTGNQAFQALAGSHGHRKCRGWYDASTKEVVGMFHIEVDMKEVGEEIEEIAGNAGGSLRFSGNSSWSGFMEFEIE